MVEAVNYDVYGRPSAVQVAHDFALLIAVRNALGQPSTGQEHLDLIDDGVIDLLDLLAARDTSLAPAQPYAFQGRQFTELRAAGGQALALYNFRAWHYDPTHGRFLQRDPAQYADSYNLYLALAANPVTRFDPEGTQSLTETATVSGIGALLAGALISSGIIGHNATLSLQDALNLRSLDISLTINEFDVAMGGAISNVIAGSFADIELFLGVVFASTKQAAAVEKAKELVPRITKHLTTLTTGGPNHPGNNSVFEELRAWLDTILRKTKHMKGKTRRNWLKFIEEAEEWLKNPWSGGGPPVAPG